MSTQSYDIIGDIHGYATMLRALLSKLGYELNDGVYRHTERKVIFVGDFIDRGPEQCEAIEIVRSMIDSGSALAVMGNHEYNAITFHTRKDNGDFLRPLTDEKKVQHKAFLDAYPYEAARGEVIDWFRTLPMWLELDGLRVIHACWDPYYIKLVTDMQDGSNHLNERLLRESSNKHSNRPYESNDPHWAIEHLLKGIELWLPEGMEYKDANPKPKERRNVRCRWFDTAVRTFRDAFFGPERLRETIPDIEIDDDNSKLLIGYEPDSKPLFIGHYWLDDEPAPLAPNIACLDYSGAHPRKLVAYRWDGETVLSKDKFVYI